MPPSIGASPELTIALPTIAEFREPISFTVKDAAFLPDNTGVLNGRGFRVHVGAASRGGRLYFCTEFFRSTARNGAKDSRTVLQRVDRREDYELTTV